MANKQNPEYPKLNIQSNERSFVDHFRISMHAELALNIQYSNIFGYEYLALKIQRIAYLLKVFLLFMFRLSWRL